MSYVKKYLTDQFFSHPDLLFQSAHAMPLHAHDSKFIVKPSSMLTHMKEKTIINKEHFENSFHEYRVSFLESSGFYLLVIWILACFMTMGKTNAQCIMICTDTNNNPPIEYAVNQNCGGVITPQIALDASINCLGPFNVSLFDTLGNPIPGSPNINAGLLDEIIVVKVTDQASGNMCQSRIHVVDHLPPSFSGCTDSVIINTGCNAATDLASIPPPAVSDNCDNNLALGFTETISGLGQQCADTYAAIIRRRWIAVDDFGNSDTCLQVIRLMKADLDDVSYTFSSTDPIEVDCDTPYDLSDLTVFGQPVVNGEPLLNGNYCDLHVHYVDDTLSGCSPAAFSIIRTWTIAELCNPTNDTVVQQVINIRDLTPPSITCPPMLTVNTSLVNCSATVVLPQATVSDDCSPFSVVPSWNFGQGIRYGYGPHLNVPVGDHIVTYTASDSCHNSSSCTMIVRVRDEVTPTPVCLEFVVVSLPDGGSTFVPAASFDNGSHDNCGIQLRQVRRLDIPGSVFGPSVQVNCDDIVASPLMVALKVTDVYGNMNTCMVQLTVQDGVPPVVICPADMTVSCTADLTNQALYGNVFLYDNCGATLDSTFVLDIDNCGTGLIRRTYTATDSKGNTDRCTQNITVVNDDPFSGSDITWPPMYSTNACISAAFLDPQDLPAPFNYPVFADHPCALIGYHYTDLLLMVAPPACYKIMRQWTVIDWCQYDEDIPGQGIWTHTQIIQVMDNVPPVIVCPANLTVTNNAICTGANVNVPLVTATDACSDVVTIVNDRNNGGANAGGFYPNGTTTVKFTAEDGCGNTAFCTVQVTVTDLTAPAAVCKEGLSANLVNMGNGQIMAMLYATTVNASSYDNCTDAIDLIFRIRKSAPGAVGVPTTSVISFDCTELGMNDIELWVIDEAGNASYCETFIDVQDNMDVCPPVSAAQAIVEGIVLTQNGEHVEQVSVSVIGADMDPCVTGASGSYSIEDLSPGGDYSIRPQKNMNPLNGVTTYDLVILQKHILGIAQLPSPYQIIAADINHSNGITAFDLVELRRVILHIYDTFPDNTSWRFIRSDYLFPNPMNPFQETFPEAYDIADIPTGVMEANFTAVKVGDLNGNATGSELTADEDRNGESNPLVLIATEQEVKAGETFTVYFRATDFNRIEGMQWALRFDPKAVVYEGLSADGILEESFAFDDSNTGLTMLDKGLIHCSWTGLSVGGTGISLPGESALLGMRFRALRPLRTSETIQFDAGMTPEAYQSEQGSTFVRPIVLVFSDRSQTISGKEGFALYQNYPNPFSGATVIGFHLPEAGEVTLTVSDISGRVRLERIVSLSAGYQEITISAEEVPTAGTYYYQLRSAAATAVKKMIRTEK